VTRSFFLHRLLTVSLSLLVVGGLTLSLSACSNDPILGPDEGEDVGDGGSYSNIQRLSPPSPAADSTAPVTASMFDLRDINPERF